MAPTIARSGTNWMATMVFSGSFGVASTPVENRVAYSQTRRTTKPRHMAIFQPPTWARKPSPFTARLAASALSAIRKNAAQRIA